MIEKATDGVSVAEAARLVGVTPQTIYGWMRKGILPAVQFNGTRTRIDPEELGKLRRAYPTEVKEATHD
jgi:excisionase family DNA binding protein